MAKRSYSLAGSKVLHNFAMARVATVTLAMPKRTNCLSLTQAMVKKRCAKDESDYIHHAP